MRILVQNLGSQPYSLDIGEWDLGMVRPLLAAKDQAGDTVDIGEMVSPWELNVQQYIRQLVIPEGSTRIITPIAGGYTVVGSPPGQLKVTFLEADDDLVSLFFGSGSGGDQVKITAADTTADYLNAKIAAGANISLVTLNPGGNEQLQISSVDERAKVSAGDTTTGLLEDKIVAGTGLTITKLNPGGNEQLAVGITAGVVKLLQTRSAELVVDAGTTALAPIYSTLLSVPITTTTGALLVRAGFSAFANKNADATFRLVVDGTPDRGATMRVGNVAPQTGAILFARAVGAGAHTVALQWSRIGGAGVALSIDAGTLPDQQYAFVEVQEVVVP